MRLVSAFVACGFAIALEPFSLAHPFPQTPARDAAQVAAPLTGSGGLGGIVRDPEGKPVRRATVRITGDMRLERMTVTDDEGKFSFSDLPSGRFTVTAEKAGFPQMSFGAIRPFRPGAGVLLQDAQQVRDLVVILARGGAITGTVYDERGEPMAGVPIMAWEIRTSLAGERTLDHAASSPDTVITDDRGTYRVFGLAPGEYTVGTSWYYHGMGFDVRVPTDTEIRAAFQVATQQAMPGANPGQPPVEPARYNYSPVFAPGIPDPLAAATFTIGPGEERAGVDLRMRLQPMSSILGTIVSPDGAPVTGSLTIERRSQVEALNSTSQRPGQSESTFNSGSLSPGRYIVMMQVPARGANPPLWAMADVMVGGGEPVPVNLVLQPTLTMTGRVVFDGKSLQPPAGLSNVSILLRGVASGWLSPTTTVDASGALTISGVVPGQYVVTASVPRGNAPGGAAWTVRSVMYGGRDVTDRPFEMPGGAGGELTVTFGDVVSELSGSLTTTSGAPATDYFVIAIPADRTFWIPRSRRIASTRPDRAGRYSFRGLPAGEYRIAVTTDLVEWDLGEVNAVEQLSAQSVTVTLATGEQRTLNLRAGGR